MYDDFNVKIRYSFSFFGVQFYAYQALEKRKKKEKRKSKDDMNYYPCRDLIRNLRLRRATQYPFCHRGLTRLDR
jgi:hypothetical protein